MINHIMLTQQKNLEQCNNFLLNVESLGFGVNRHFWLDSNIQAKQQQQQNQSQTSQKAVDAFLWHLVLIQH